MKMKKLLFGMVLVVSLLIAAAGIGCASLSEYATPAIINQRAVDFVVESGVADPNEFEGWPNLHKALKLDSYVDMAYEIRYTTLKQSIENLEIDYGHLNDIVTKNLEAAQEREQELFADGGVLATALTAGGLGSFVGLLGLFRKRPGDMTKEDFQRAIEPIQGELGVKDQQFAQVITGVERFMKHKDEITSLLSKDGDAAEKTDQVLKLMKTYLGRSQDASTQQEVAKVRAVV
jgi:hypothetical protein